MSKVWVSSDLHFNHKRIIEFCPASRGHCESLDHMNQTIINNFNSVIAEEDTLYLLGDIGFGEVGPALDLIRQLNGQKVWIHGNHDRKFWGNDLYHQQKESLRIIEDTPYKTIWHRIKESKYQIVMFHFPIESWENSQRGSIHLHGHLHSGANQKVVHRKMDVGVDGNALMPYNMDDIVKNLHHMPINDDYHPK
jgi:calcineurin-like phosphoesterase family protein